VRPWWWVPNTGTPTGMAKYLPRSAGEWEAGSKTSSTLQIGLTRFWSLTHTATSQRPYKGCLRWAEKWI